MSVRDYVEQLRSKPEHARKQVALSTSFGVAGVVFASWAVALVSSGSLALSPQQEPTPLAEETREAGRDLAGAAAAFSSAFKEEGTLTAVETRASTTLDQEDTGEATVIPF